MRVLNASERSVGYRLNFLGIRVWSDRCQLVIRDRNGEWAPIGVARALPVQIPEDVNAIGSDSLLLTAYQYDHERSGSDLRAVLAKTKDFESALVESSQATSAT